MREKRITENDAVIEEILDETGYGVDAALPVLLRVQGKKGWISGDTIEYLARRLKIQPAYIYGLSTFYAYLRTKLGGRHVIHLCRDSSCEGSGSFEIAKALQKKMKIKIGETTPDGSFTLKWASCIGRCDEGPAMLINEEAYTGLTPKTAVDIISSISRKRKK